MKAVVIPDRNEITVQEVELAAPKAGEVKVKMAATGVCHSDLSVINGTIPTPTPLVVGHEGAGVVEEVGDGVTNVKPGDHVILSFVPFCKECFFCLRGQPYLCEQNGILGQALQLDRTTRITMNGQDLGAMCGLGCMAPYAVVPSISVVPIADDIPLQVAALVGCAVTTGVGAALNTAQVSPGSSVAVFGCGGVGLSAIQGARVAGAERIIAVDLSDDKLDMAKTFGATHAVKADDDAFKNIRKLTSGKGVDYAFEAIGVAKVMELATSVTRAGGTTVMVGIGGRKDRMSLSAFSFPLQAKKVCGCMYGGANPPVDFPRLLGLYQAGKLDLDNMITKTYTIDEAAQAFADLESGKNARGVIVFD
jgi:S-(hydroxymethyl)glutathione dehydrogenase/alcohol dehydrogenase